MDFKHVPNQELINRLDKLVKTERKITHVILCHINEMESRRLYAELGFDSMFKYLTSHCGYGEDSAYRRLQAARLLKKTPEIAEKLEEGSLNLTQLTYVQKCIKQERKSGFHVGSEKTLQILEQIQNKSSYETKKMLAVEFNQPIQGHDVLTPQKDESVRLELTLTQEQMEKLTQAKDLLSHILPAGTWADVISHLAEKQIRKSLGKKRQEILSEPAAEKKTPSVSPPSFMTTRKRTPIKITTRRKILQKAHHCCEYVDPKTKTKCQSRFQLQLDHRVPVALGGSNSENNLRILCRTHNLLAAKQWGVGKLVECSN